MDIFINMRQLLIVMLYGLLQIHTACFAAHAISQYGTTPKYPANFTHFDYVNPNAPQNGSLVLANPDRRTSFDKFNPFSLKGEIAPGIADLMFESLLIGSNDEVATGYGLLAEDVVLASDGLSIIFHLNPKARFHNGDPVLAKDVKYSFDTLISKQASPVYRSLLADIKQAYIISERMIRFDFKRQNRELPLIIGSLPIFSSAWGRRPDGSVTPFEQLTFETPIGSGPYLIERYTSGRNISFQRNPNYWGKNLNVRRGTFNFKRITYQLYGDDTARIEAFKAGEFDALVEYRAKNWARGLYGAKFRNGTLVKQSFSNSNGAGMQGFILNQRRPLFQDIRVRQALALALDFEWLNHQLFYNQYQRINSYFTNTELAASSTIGGLPGEDEKKLLQELDARFPKQLPDRIWGAAPIPPSTNPPHNLRDNLRMARHLLAQAGWHYRDGALRNHQGKPFVIEYLDDGSGFGKVVAAYARNLEKLGIQISERSVEFALYQKRLDEFDYDMITLRMPSSQSPGNELFAIYGSRAAKEKGTSNFIGVQSVVVDAIIEKVVEAKTRAELITAARVLDRFLLHQYYVIPHWFNDKHRIAYNTKLTYPTTLPLYYSAEGWIVQNWWVASSHTNTRKIER
jgi:microcin C transport system substrate-binding protein